MSVPSTGLDATRTARRKDDHIEINLTQPVQARDVTTGFERIRFVHQALPEIDLADVRLGTTFLEYALGAPLLVSAMTGGVSRGWEITRRLAIAAQTFGLPMGVGSQRAALEDPHRATWFHLRDVAPDVFLMANIGAIQLNHGYGVEECRRAMDMLQANALVLHLNPLQEALQAEGDTDFRGLLGRIEALCRVLPVPVVVKEIGCGISTRVARQLADAGVAAIDTAGAGGTSWSAVERYRATDDLRQRLGETFAEWGIPTATSLRMVQEGAPGLPVIASGGMRTGLDAACALACGASLVGFAGPFLMAANSGQDAIDSLIRGLIEELRLAMFCTGAASLDDLCTADLIDDAGNPIIRRQPDADRKAGR